MPVDEREFEKIGLWQWLTGCMCWEIKTGFLLVAAGSALWWFTDLKLPYTDRPLGMVLLGLGALGLSIGLAKDLRMVSCRRKERKGTS